MTKKEFPFWKSIVSKMVNENQVITTKKDLSWARLDDKTEVDIDELKWLIDNNFIQDDGSQLTSLRFFEVTNAGRLNLMINNELDKLDERSNK